MKNIINSKSSLEEKYRYYSERYDKIEKNISKKFDSEMRGEKLDKNSFRFVLEGMVEDDPKTSQQLIINKLVTKQSSEVSYKQAKVLQASLKMKEEDKIPTINELRYGKHGLLEMIKRDYHSLIASGVSVLEAKQYITDTYYFGSD